ncbi:MAG TPA: sulfite exporter TauE/SafE family protein [Acidimicrobiales bacterium]
MTPGVYVVAALAVAAAACVHGALGFGLGTVAAPVLALLDERFVPGPLLCVGVVLTLVVAYRERGALDVRGVRWAILGRVPGTLLGAAAVASLPQRGLIVLFALLVLAGVVLSVAGLQVEPTPSANFGAGAASGFMGTITSVGGPAMALLYQREEGARLRATLALFFVFGAALSLGSLTVTGAFGAEELRLGLALLPPTLLGYALSALSARWLDRGRTRAAILWFAGLTSGVLLLREVLTAL